MLPDKFTGFRAGPLCRLAEIEQGTKRAWENAGLPLGDRNRTGHPRYTLADAVKLRIVDRLRDPFFRLPLHAAIGFVIYLGSAIESEVAAHVDEGLHYRPAGTGRRILIAEYRYEADQFVFSRIVESVRGAGTLHGDGFRAISDPPGIRVHVDITEHTQKALFIHDQGLAEVAA